MLPSNIEDEIFSIKTLHEFNELAIKIFYYQYENCEIYQNFINNLGFNASKISRYDEIPCIPVSFFKTHKVVSYDEKYETAKIFQSSTTTGQKPSFHYVHKIEVYEQSFRKAFQMFYGNISDYVFIALLPSYIERGGSSLLYMMDDFITKSNQDISRFCKEINTNQLNDIIQKIPPQKKLILFGVSYALLDLFEHDYFHVPDHCLLFETGGMKGKRAEISKEEFYSILYKNTGTHTIHSEYGMTELLSQAYGKNGIYKFPPWVKVCTREIYDPLTLCSGKPGALNIIDLANIYSCSFIATDDIAFIHKDQSFEIKGRLDSSEIRGCNLLYE